MDIQLNSTGHIDLTNGVLSLIRDRPTLVAQRLSVRLRTYLGEWFTDIDMGIDWFADVLIKNVSKFTVDSIIQNEISKDDYVIAVKTFKSSVNNRNYSCEFTVEVKCLDKPIQMKYLANENNIFVTDENGNYLLIEV